VTFEIPPSNPLLFRFFLPRYLSPSRNFLSHLRPPIIFRYTPTTWRTSLHTTISLPPLSIQVHLPISRSSPCHWQLLPRHHAPKKAAEESMTQSVITLQKFEDDCSKAPGGSVRHALVIDARCVMTSPFSHQATSYSSPFSHSFILLAKYQLLPL
jgi:hypothetical protein